MDAETDKSVGEASQVNANSTYEEGMRDGRIQSIEAMQAQQNLRLDNHAMRISSLEKGGYVLLGVIAAIEFFPLIVEFLRGIS